MQLLTVELHGSVLETALAQVLGQSVEGAQLVGIVAVFSFQDLLYFLVGIAAVALDDGMGQVPVFDVGVVVEFEDDAITELLFVGAQ